MITVRKLIWDTWNVSHIARHKVTPDEIEAVCHGAPIVLRGQQKNRLVLIGSTDEKRILTVVLEPKANSSYCPITAYPSGKNDIALYNRLTGGDENEKN